MTKKSQSSPEKVRLCLCEQPPLWSEQDRPFGDLIDCRTSGRLWGPDRHDLPAVDAIPRRTHRAPARTGTYGSTTRPSLCATPSFVPTLGYLATIPLLPTNKSSDTLAIFVVIRNRTKPTYSLTAIRNVISNVAVKFDFVARVQMCSPLR